MELQTYLREEGLEKLCDGYYIKTNRHQQYPNLVCLKYSQIDSPMSEKVVQQSRGIIVDEANNWEIVSYSYDKFFNYGEHLAANIDWESTTIYDKLDGSLMVLYYYDRQWRVQSSGTADGGGQVGGFKFTFAELFWNVWQELDYQLPQETDYCFSFELLTRYNRIVVQQNSNNLILHGVRNIKTLKEEKPKVWAKKYNYNLVKTFSFQNWQEIIETAEKLEPWEAEGYVICDRHFNRIKVKSSQYVAWSHFVSGYSNRSMLQIIANNEGEEFLTYYPEWKENFDKMKKRYQELVQEIEEKYNEHKSIPVQKDFALAVKHLPYCGILFALRSGKSNSVKESLSQTTIHKLEQLLGQEYFDLENQLQ